jgi:predicted 3-demethylubiquinone-9 3-methyltransferase (glyoxalase superfamily)
MQKSSWQSILENFKKHSEAKLLKITTIKMKQKIGLCLWFDNQAEEAARFYTSIFRNSKNENIDYYWGKLTEGGEEGQCGWLKDKFGLSWQIIPNLLSELMSDRKRAEKVTRAFMQMKKLDIEKLKEGVGL